MSACQVILPQPLPANVLPLILPTVWAFGARLPVGYEAVRPDLHRLRPDFYRKYTEALLRRYIRLSMEVGKVPSLIGQEMFRGKVTSYRVAAFDDVVIADLSVLKTQMKEIVGNGQPGRLAQLETRIQSHERTVQRLKGIAAAFGGVLTFAHVAIDFILARR